MRSKLFIAVLVVTLAGCATTAATPTSTKMNDAIMMGIKTSSTGPVAFEYTSNVQDGQIQPSKKDSREIDKDLMVSYTHTENTTLSKMLNEYASMKFAKQDSASSTKLKITLKDFWIEQYSPDSTGSQVFAAMFGGEIKVIVAVNLDLSFEVTKDGSTNTKNVRISTDSSKVVGIGTGTSSSNVYQGEQNIEYKNANAMNDANNKAIVMLNQFVESSQL